MAALSPIDASALTPSRLPREPVRLAVAITVSALVHLWLASGVTVRAPGHAAVRGPEIISARLEIPATPLAEPSPIEGGAEGVHEAVPDSRHHIRPADQSMRKAARNRPSTSSVFPEKMQDARVVAAALPSISDPVYYPAHELDVYPALVRPVNLEYPRYAGNEYASGRVQVMLLIDEKGGVREFSIIGGGVARAFEQLIRAAFSEARFLPARKDGRAVKSRMLIAVDYRR
jgi:protein TonB